MKPYRRNRLVWISMLLLCVAIPMVVDAQVGIKDPLGGQTLAGLLVRLTNWLLGLVAILSLLGVVAGGVRMIISIGDESGVASAKKIIFWSVAGLVVSGLALFIITTVAKGVLGLTSVDGGFFIPSAYAQDPLGFNEANKVKLPQLSADTVAENILNVVTSLAAVIALAVFIWGAVRMVTSLGDESKAESAKKVMLYAVIGLLLVGMAWVVIRLVGGILGVRTIS